MSQSSTKEHAFVIETLAHLMDHITHTEEEVGNKEILYSVIAKEIREHSEEILKK